MLLFRKIFYLFCSGLLTEKCVIKKKQNNVTIRQRGKPNGFDSCQISKLPPTKNNNILHDIPMRYMVQNINLINYKVHNTGIKTV